MGSIGHVTRMWPRRVAEVLDGGSLYWIIKGVMRVRQEITGFEEWPSEDPGGKAKMPDHLGAGVGSDRTLAAPPVPGLALSGAGRSAARSWCARSDNDDMPPELVAELRSLGAW